jgi:cysteinyl-tRNA synthetase
MSIRLFNTATGRKEEFVPLAAGRVGMYVCGVTVYDLSHLGHARGAVMFDVIRRYLAYRGFDVTYVRNFTDVDDKIIQRANERGEASSVLAARFIDEYVKDMDALGVRRADIEPKATEHIPEIVDLCQRLVDAGHAYAVGADVYFRVKSFNGYAKLSGRDLDDLMAGARVEVDERKENPLDFALWKGSKPGEPSWPSPWGPGRPGWHIECSAMAMKHLGESIDIHGGGKDLVFPHHENEIAQSEAATGKPFARYWMHNGFVNVDREKMSKSLGNFFTIRDILAKYDAEVVRLFLLSTHYRNPIDFSDQNLRDKEGSLVRFYSFFQSEMEALAASAVEAVRPSGDELLEQYDRELDALLADFEAAMDDDFNTAMAVGRIFKSMNMLNDIFRHPGLTDANRKHLARRWFELVGPTGRISSTLGVFNSTRDEWVGRIARFVKAGDVDERAAIDARVEERNRLRREKKWQEADAVRDALAAEGIVIKDGPEGTTWSRAR